MDGQTDESMDAFMHGPKGRRMISSNLRAGTSNPEMNVVKKLF